MNHYKREFDLNEIFTDNFQEIVASLLPVHQKPDLVELGIFDERLIDIKCHDGNIILYYSYRLEVYPDAEPQITGINATIKDGKVVVDLVGEPHVNREATEQTKDSSDGKESLFKHDTI